MVDRVTYRRRKSFRTASNVVRKVKTPGGKLVLHYMGKKGKLRCGEGGVRAPAARRAGAPPKGTRASARQKKVSRAYGGSRCGVCVRKRIVRAFLIEEQKIVKKVLKRSSRRPRSEPGEARLGPCLSVWGGAGRRCEPPLPRLPHRHLSPLPHPTSTPPCGLRAC